MDRPFSSPGLALRLLPFGLATAIGIVAPLVTPGTDFEGNWRNMGLVAVCVVISIFDLSASGTTANKDAIMVKFQPITIDGIELWAHKRLLRDWGLLSNFSSKRAKAGRAGGLAKAGNKKFVQECAEPVSNDEDDAIEANESDV